jgi:hypothetical protein
MKILLQNKIQDLISLEKEGWGDIDHGLITSTHTNYYSYSNNENDITKVLHSLDLLISKKGIDNLKRKKFKFSNGCEDWKVHYYLQI